MRCAWDALMSILPVSFRAEVDKQGRDGLRELRLRLDKPPELVFAGRRQWLSGRVEKDDLEYCINVAGKYSPWAAAGIGEGYLTAKGGHRIGICGETAESERGRVNFRSVSSLCIRVARDIPGISAGMERLQGNILILGRPGSGKTTLLRDYIRRESENRGVHMVVVDERCEIFPSNNGVPMMDTGKATDVLSGCGKAWGVECALRTMSPDRIAVDEITAAGDCDALLKAGRCGVPIVATAHATSIEDLRLRPVYKPLYESRLFDYAVILQPDSAWKGAYIRYDA